MVRVRKMNKRRQTKCVTICADRLVGLPEPLANCIPAGAGLVALEGEYSGVGPWTTLAPGEQTQKTVMRPSVVETRAWIVSVSESGLLAVGARM